MKNKKLKLESLSEKEVRTLNGGYDPTDGGCIPYPRPKPPILPPPVE